MATSVSDEIDPLNVTVPISIGISVDASSP